MDYFKYQAVKQGAAKSSLPKPMQDRPIRSAYQAHLELLREAKRTK